MGPVAVGSAFAGHMIEELVGRGGMGVVYRAREIGLDRVVALKLLAPDAVEDPVARERFLAEARAAASIEHPHVVPIYHAGEADGIAYLVMRYIEGDDARTLVRRDGALEPARAARIVADAGAGLDAIHRGGLVHRDVKPANLLLDADDNVYMTDFGLARSVQAYTGDTRSGRWAGTLSYAAPEQIRGGRIDARTDVYALGAVLVHLLTGRAPFDRDTDEAILWAHLRELPPRPSHLRPGVHPAFDGVIARAMAKDPADRYTSTGELGRAALAAAGGRAEPAPPRRRSTPLLAAGAAAAAAAITTAIVLAAPGGHAPASTPTPTSTAVRHARPPLRSQLVAHVTERPNGIAVVGDELWVTAFRRTRIVRLDKATGRRLGLTSDVGPGVRWIVSTPSVVWVAVGPAHLVIGLDPRTGKRTHVLPTTDVPIALAAGHDGLWALTRGTTDSVVQLHADGGAATVHTIPQGALAIAAGGGSLWIATTDARILRLSPGATTPVVHAALADPGSALAWGAGHVWASIVTANAVARMDPHGLDHFEVDACSRPQNLVVAAGRVVVACYTDQSLAILDTAHGRRIARVPVGMNPYALTSDGRSVWVIGIADGSVRRVDLR